MKAEPIMRNVALCLSCLLLTLVGPSVFADVILKDGKVVKVGRNAVVVAGKIRIADCTTGEIAEYDQANYEFKKGRDCSTSPAKKKSPMREEPPAKPQDPANK